MKMQSRSVRVLKILASTSLGVGTTAALDGCDPAVRSAWLTGLQTTTGTLLQTFNSAFYLSLDDEGDSSSDTLTTT